VRLGGAWGLTIAVAASAAAQTPPPTAQPSRIVQTSRFFAGAAAGLLIHETGHVVFGAALDAHPRVARIDYGGVPFFAIHHANVSAKKEFAISSAGFWMQHAGSEWVLSARPRLEQESAPFVKGVLAFNLAASAVYGISAFGRFGPPERDPRSMAASLGRDGVPEPAIGVLILAPAALDFYRYEHPNARWAVWTSRSIKVLAVALTAAAGR
jgi:hypothetical protein